MINENELAENAAASEPPENAAHSPIAATPDPIEDNTTQAEPAATETPASETPSAEPGDRFRRDDKNPPPVEYL